MNDVFGNRGFRSFVHVFLFASVLRPLVDLSAGPRDSGIALTDAPALSVQHHPEASPGPEDSFYIFKRFVEKLKAA